MPEVFLCALTVRASESRASSLPWMLCRALPNLSERKGQKCYMQWCNMGQPYDINSGKYAFALTGRGLPGCIRLPRVSLRLPWAMRSLGFQPVVPDDSGCLILHIKQDILFFLLSDWLVTSSCVCVWESAAHGDLLFLGACELWLIYLILQHNE